MFTGIITDIGEIAELEQRGDLRARILCHYDRETIDIGASIACNGACLTVIDTGYMGGRTWFDVEISAESVAKTNIGSTWQPGARLNLERALKIGDELGVDARTLYHYNAIVITPAMAAKMPEGRGSKYSSTYVDVNGDYLDGSKTYMLRVPPNVPVREFWSITVYDPATRSQLQTGQPLPSISSQQNPPANKDGSVDIYFAPKQPKGVAEENWIQTVAGKGFFPFYRFYGPLKAFNDQTWKPVEIELVK